MHRYFVVELLLHSNVIGLLKSNEPLFPILISDTYTVYLSDITALIAVRAVLVVESMGELVDDDSTHAPEVPALQICRGVI
jgi:hypothetical protein